MSHVDVIDDGTAAVTWEPMVGVVRMIDHVPHETHPSYQSIGHVTRMSESVAKLSGFSGHLSRRHMWLLCDLLRRQGYTAAYMQRAASHAMPWGREIPDGDWAGWWRVDLAEMRGRRRSDV